MNDSDGPIPLVDLRAAHAPHRERLIARFTEVLDSGRFILGEQVAGFEREVEAHLGARHAVGVSNGTDALVCALAAAGVGPGTRVLVPALSFFASVSAVLRVGARPIFCDVDAETFQLDPVDAATRGDFDAVLVVHLFGQPAPLAAIRALARGRPLIEDAAQAFGASYGPDPIGSSGLCAFSFFPAKPLGALGDSGLVTTDSAAIAERCRALRAHGRGADGAFHWLGGNYRLDEVQATLLRAALPHERDRRQRRQAHAARYSRAFRGVQRVITPQVRPALEHSFSVYALRIVERRDQLRQHLAARGIETAVYYPRALPFEPLLASLGHRAGEFPVAERLCRELLAIPVSADLTEVQQQRVIEAILSYF